MVGNFCCCRLQIPLIFGSVIFPHLPTRAFVCLLKVVTCLPSLVRGLLGTDPLDPTLDSASPSPQGRFGIETGSNQEIDVESMSERC